MTAAGPPDAPVLHEAGHAIRMRLAYRSANGSMGTRFEMVMQVAVHARTVIRTLLPTRNAVPEVANRVL